MSSIRKIVVKFSGRETEMTFSTDTSFGSFKRRVSKEFEVAQASVEFLHCGTVMTHPDETRLSAITRDGQPIFVVGRRAVVHEAPASGKDRVLREKQAELLRALEALRSQRDALERAREAARDAATKITSLEAVAATLKVEIIALGGR